MLRYTFVLYIFVTVANCFLTLDTPDAAETQQAVILCHARYLEVPENLVKDLQNSSELFISARDNVSGVKCFITCLWKTINPEFFYANGKIMLGKISAPSDFPK